MIYSKQKHAGKIPKIEGGIFGGGYETTLNAEQEESALSAYKALILLKVHLLIKEIIFLLKL